MCQVELHLLRLQLPWVTGEMEQGLGDKRGKHNWKHLAGMCCHLTAPAQLPNLPAQQVQQGWDGSPTGKNTPRRMEYKKRGVIYRGTHQLQGCWKCYTGMKNREVPRVWHSRADFAAIPPTHSPPNAGESLQRAILPCPLLQPRHLHGNCCLHFIPAAWDLNKNNCIYFHKCFLAHRD